MRLKEALTRRLTKVLAASLDCLAALLLVSSVCLAALLLVSHVCRAAPRRLAQGASSRVVALFPFPEGGRWGYRDRAGRWVIGPRFRWANPFVDGMAEVWQDDRKFYIDAAGNEVADRNFASDHFSEGLITVRVGNRVGFDDREGRLVIFPRFEGASDFSEGLAPVEAGGKWGYVDREGRFVIEPRFDEAASFSEGLAAVCLYEGKPAETPRNQPLSEEEFEWFFLKGPKKKCGYVDRAGASAIAPQFGEADTFSEGLAAVCFGRCVMHGSMPPGEEGDAPKWGYIDKAGRTVIAPRFADAKSFAEGLAAVRVGEKYGYIDAGGRLIIPARFEWAQSFGGGLALVALGETKYYWPHRGTTVLGVGLRGKYGYVDKTGKFVSDRMTWKGKWKK